MKEEIDMAYTAAILDGDGSFSLLLHRNTFKPSWKSFYHPCIQLSNAFKGMSEWLNEMFEGSLRVKKPQKEHHKPLYVWSNRSKLGCKNIIEKVLPYLVLKKQQANLVLDFINSDHNDLISGERFNLKMKNLNREILLDCKGLSEQTIVNSENSEFWSYLAGIMDTEGSFSFKKEKPHSGSINIRYSPMIQLTMVPSAVLNFIRKNSVYGSFCIPKVKSAEKKFGYKMNICAKDDCVEFINRILPYLKFKREQALTMKYFCENSGNVKHKRAGIPKEILDFRESCYQKMRQLNK